MLARTGKSHFGKALLLFLMFATFMLWRHTLAFGQATGPRLKVQFRDFLAKPIEIEKKASLKAPAGDGYQELRERYENSSINFGGKYVLVRISCGAGCETGWIVNALTGSMYDLPSVYCLPEPSWRNFQKIEFRRNSILLVLTGILNVDEPNDRGVNARRYYYRFDGTKLRLITSEPIKVAE